MNKSRRLFFRQAVFTSILLSTDITGAFAEGDKNHSLKPPRLKEGDTIGLISPSGAVYESEPFDIAKEVFEAMGLKVKFSEHLKDRYGHLGGTDEARASEINTMFADKSINGIVCIRGGSGAARILDLLDYKTIADNPKVFVGYSDITALLLAIYTKTGLVTFHGPVGISDWNSFSNNYFKKILFDGELPVMQNPGKEDDELVQTENRIRTINSGSGSGILVGGNLSVLTGLIGSKYLPGWKGKILFVEEVDEKIHAIDRMMSQLKLAGVFDQLSGFVMGHCSNCTHGDGYGSLTLEEVIDYYIKPLQIPAFSGAMIGHISKKFTVPEGIKATIDADKGIIVPEEAAVL